MSDNPPASSQRLLWGGVAVFGLQIAGAIAFVWLHQPAAPARSTAPEYNPAMPRSSRAADVPAVRFTDITAAAGITFRHTNGAFGKKLMPETLGSGVAFIDYDNDGHPDLLFINGCHWPGCEAGKPQPRALTLYRNDGTGKFTDVTEAVGLGKTPAGQTLSMFGMGVTVGDYDNDGWPDIFVTGVGGNRLFRNTDDGSGGRRFIETTAEAGVGGPGGWPTTSNEAEFLAWTKPVTFSTSAAFLDYDGDGRLDLFVCNYVTWSPDFDWKQNFNVAGQGRAYGPPRSFEGAQCFLYRNVDGKHFEDVSEKAGIRVVDREGVGDKDRVRNVGKSLGVIVCDVDDDGRPDIIVANDTVRNFLFHNQGDGTFKEMGRVAGVDADSTPRGAMGIDWGEYRPGRPALVIGNFANEPNTFLTLTKPKSLFFTDAAVAEGMAGPSRTLLKFGALFLDYDLDGRLDVITCNGHLDPDVQLVQTQQTYAQPAQLFWNAGTSPCFEPVRPEQAGPDLFKPMVGRAAAYADIDGDGDLDLVLTENGGPARLLRNDGGNRNNWIRLRLIGDGVRSNTSAIGAKVTLEAGGLVQRREVCSARGYLSQSELTLTFGLGKTSTVDKVTIRWPGKDAGTTELKNLAAGKEYKVEQK
jgi:hypothetical protein